MIGCTFTEGTVPEPLGGSLTVSGRIVDFKSGAPVAGTATISTSGLHPPPRITTNGTTFTIDVVPEYSVFHVLASVPPTHRATYSPPIEVTNSDRDDVELVALSEQYISELAGTFSFTPSATRGTLMVQLRNSGGQPFAGITAAALSMTANAGQRGPYFLDANANPTTGMTATSASGWVVYFDVMPGVVGLEAAAGSGLTVDMPLSPINAGAVTIVRAKVTEGAVVAPTNVSFMNDVFPVFRARGCVGCHEKGNGIGRRLGDLTLNNDANLAYRELVEERLTRVVVAAPDSSLLLTRPLREDPADVHPNVTFANTLDPDYQKIRAWIAEGAKPN